MRAGVVVVGGGIMGVSIAWHLARRLDPHTDPVVLLEKKELAAGSSGRSGAILRQFYGDREVAAMARDSLRVFRGFEGTTGRSIAFMHSGVLTLGSRAKAGEAELVEKNVAMMQSIGIDVELVDAQGLRALVPGLRVSDATIAAWEPDAGGVDPVLAVNAFAALAREHGAVTRVGVRAEELLVEHGRLRGVRTNEGVIECARAVVAAGPWTRPIFERIGVELPLRVVRPEQHFLSLPGAAAGAPPERPASPTPAALARPDEAERFARFGDGGTGLGRAPHPVMLDLEHGFYSRCDLVTRRTRVGHMDYRSDVEVVDPDRVDERVTAEFQAWARAQLATRLPRYEHEPDAGSFVGMYTLTPDAQAVLGQVEGRDGPIDGLYVASGFSGHGFKLSPSIGEGMAQMVLGAPVSAFDPAFFAPARFRGAAARRSGAFGL